MSETSDPRFIETLHMMQAVQVGDRVRVHRPSGAYLWAVVRGIDYEDTHLPYRIQFYGGGTSWARPSEIYDWRHKDDPRVDR